MTSSSLEAWQTRTGTRSAVALQSDLSSNVAVEVAALPCRLAPRFLS